MNYRAASRAVSEERQLPAKNLFVDLRFALFLYIAANLFFTGISSDRTDIVTIRPELAAPELLLYGRNSAEYLARSYALDRSHDLGWTVAWYRLHEEMYMVWVCADFQEPYLIPLLYRQTDFLQHLLNFGRKHRSAILDRTHNVIHQNRNIVTLMK